MVVFVDEPNYIGGRYPVYYKFHGKTDFSMEIAYQYDGTKLKPEQVEEAVRALFKPLTQAVTHIDTYGEEDAYKTLGGLALPNVKVLDANIIDADGREQPCVFIPVTRLPNLTGIAFAGTDISEGGA
jgi:hypothetical protein